MRSAKPTKPLPFDEYETRLIHICQMHPLPVVGEISGEEAFAELYRKYEEKIIKFAFHQVGKDRDRAEDIALETLAQAFKKIETFKPQRCSFSGWLMGFAKKLIQQSRCLYMRRAKIKKIKVDSNLVQERLGQALYDLSLPSVDGPIIEGTIIDKLDNQIVKSFLLMAFYLYQRDGHLDYLEHKVKNLMAKYGTNFPWKAIIPKVGVSKIEDEAKYLSHLLATKIQSFDGVMTETLASQLIGHSLRKPQCSPAHALSFQKDVEELLKEHPNQPTAIYNKLRLRGFTGSSRTVWRLIKKIRKPA